MKEILEAQLQEALDYDATRVVNDLTNGDYFPEKGMVTLSLSMDNNRRLDELLVATNDTGASRQTVEQYIAIIESLGFEKVFEEELPLEEEEKANNRFYMFWRKGILLRFDTYFGHSTINSADAYFNFEVNEGGKQPRGCNGYITLDEDKRAFIGSVDARDAFRLFIETSERNGQFLEHWIEKPFLWLLSYVDTRGEYDYKAINAKRISKLPKEIQDAISPTA